MCLVGLVSQRITSFRLAVDHALTTWCEEPYAWSVAVHANDAWTQREAHHTLDDAHATEVTITGTGELLVAHIEKRSSLTTTQPFQRDGWAMAHAGPIDDIDLLRKRTSQKRALQIDRETDSEILFAYLLSCVDASSDVDEALQRAIAQIESCGARGSFSFVLADGNSLYAHRSGRPMLVLARPAEVFVASNALTDEPWCALVDGALVRVDRTDRVTWRYLRGRSVEVSGPELPFTD